MPGKPWVGTTQPKLVLHTLEFYGWPNSDRWDSPSHYVYNPWTAELRQYVREGRAAYSLRDNAQEDDELTIQVEMFGKAALIPGYSDTYYQNVARLVVWARDKFGIPVEFADFDFQVSGSASKYAPQRMKDPEVTAFSGFIGHCHMGWGIDEHWDPGRLDVARVKEYIIDYEVEDNDMIIAALKQQTMEWYEVLQDKTGSPGGNASYWGSNYPGTSPSPQEWANAAPELFAAALQAGVLGPYESGGSVDTVARAGASRANERLDGIVVPS
jgi:hypothetical protein